MVHNKRNLKNTNNNEICILVRSKVGFPGGASGKELACQCRRHKKCGFDPWVKKIPWGRKGQPTTAFLPGESYGQIGLAGCSPWGPKELDITKVTEHAYALFGSFHKQPTY